MKTKKIKIRVDIEKAITREEEWEYSDDEGNITEESVKETLKEALETDGDEGDSKITKVEIEDL